MQQRTRPTLFRPVLPYRPLQTGSTTSAFILSGGGIAVLIQHNIFTFLYDPDRDNPDLRALGRTAPALQLVAQTWRQVDTPSVASPVAQDD